MMTRIAGLLLTLSLALLIILGVLLLPEVLSPTTSTVSAQGPDGHSVYYVAPDCTGIMTPCYTVVQDAVDDVDDDGDVVQVAQGIYTGVNASGTYTQMVHLTKTLTLRGGYAPDFASWDPAAYPTVLDAQRLGHVFCIFGSGSPVIEGLRITGGDTGVGGGFWGAGILAIGDSGPALTVTLRHNDIISNYATTGFAGGGGLATAFSNLILEDNLIEHNQTDGAGGGARFEQSNIRLTNNVIRDNHASASGGGIYMAYYTNARMTNTVLIDNAADFAGGAMAASGAYVRMKHTTVARNHSGDGTGIYVTGGGIHGKIVSTVLMTNSIFVSHTWGIIVTGAPQGFTHTAELEHTLWDEVGILAGGVGDITVTAVYTGDPAFAADGYHIQPTSDAVDRGVAAHVHFDIDNQPRPVRAGYDLGADEVGFFAFLPVILKDLGP